MSGHITSIFEVTEMVSENIERSFRADIKLKYDKDLFI
jgi:hypothetical protein